MSLVGVAYDDLPMCSQVVAERDMLGLYRRFIRIFRDEADQSATRYQPVPCARYLTSISTTFLAAKQRRRPCSCFFGLCELIKRHIALSLMNQVKAP